MASSVRIVSLVPSITELLVDLGVREQLVGCTKFCVHPPSLREEVAVVGGTKNVRVQAVQDLRPDLVIASKEENVREQVEVIRSFSEVLVYDVVDISSAKQMILHLGQHLDCLPAAERIVDANAATIKQLYQANQGTALYLIWRNPFMAAGGDTYIHSMLEAVGYSNVLADAERYPSLAIEDIQALAPAHLLLSSEPYPFKPQHLDEMQQLCPQAQVSLVDGELYSWYGSRLSKLLLKA